MSDGKISYKTSHDVTLIVDPQYITVDKNDWARLKREVNNCKHHTDWWMNLAFAFFGVAGSAFITWLSMAEVEANAITRIVLLCVAIACLIIGVIGLFAHHSFICHYEADLNDVKQVVIDIEDKLPKE